MNKYDVTILITRQYTVSVEAEDEDEAREDVEGQDPSEIADTNEGVAYSTEIIEVECTEEDDGECPSCGGSGGGEDAALRCGSCGGSGVRDRD
jgi:hypothetical protein